ncbi:MAG: hypothetical protein R8G66_16940 [Cytophagales bacterium]|nr:hypothetical protein [Cytophagales bacterium]
MTRRNYKVRRALFKEGQYQQHRNFRQFREQYRERRRKDWRMKIAIGIAILILLVTLMFGVSAESTDQRLQNYSEIEFKNANQKL